MDKPEWTAYAVQILVKDYPAKGTKIPELISLGFTPRSISSKAARLNIKQLGYYWTPEDIKLLEDKYPTQGSNIQELRCKGFAETRICSKAQKLGIKFIGSSEGACARWTPKEDDIVRRDYPSLGSNIPSLLSNGRTRATINARAQKLGVTWVMSRGVKITYNNVVYNTAREACEAAGVDTVSFYNASNKMKGSHSPQEIFDYVRNELVTHGYWSESEVELLRENYPDKGADIPELLKKYSATAIRSKAALLGLKHREFESVRFQDKDVSMRTVERYYGVQHGVAAYALREKGISHQQLVDRFIAMHSVVDGVRTRTVISFTAPLEDYINVDGKLWSPAIYYDYFRPRWTMAQFTSAKSRHGLTAQQTLDFLEGRLQLDSFKSDRSMRRARTVRNSDIQRTAFGYVGTDGHTYCFVQCSKCNRVQLMTDNVFHAFVHDTVKCVEREVPTHILLPSIFKHKTSG